MRFNIMGSMLAGAVAMVLTGCGESTAGGADQVSAGKIAPDKAGQSYELVIATKPLSVEKETAIARAGYEMCAVAAKAMGVAVKPLVALPKDYVMSRRTYRSDGVNFFEQEEGYTLDSHHATPQNGCDTKITYTSNTDVGSPARSRHIDITAEGERVVQDNEPRPAAGPDLGAAEVYTVAKQIGGRAYKCMPPGSPGFLPSMKEMCILDTKGATLSNIDGRAIVAYARQKSPLADTELVTEVERASVGEKLAANAFAEPVAR
ncbi:hypothetical protein KW842_10215 [Duganella sp. sic0402]|uniref:hypothetical protein n=1 Tax=Duganella sp. sic0402 TaxID=2854786 RepID=UPI001C465C71|nr:hypothetical protein [Duganella sp. sic0402]MBV7536139.1 hypothetical protein [Duganella sp. sic0402]